MGWEEKLLSRLNLLGEAMHTALLLQVHKDSRTRAYNLIKELEKFQNA